MVLHVCTEWDNTRLHVTPSHSHDTLWFSHVFKLSLSFHILLTVSFIWTHCQCSFNSYTFSLYNTYLHSGQRSEIWCWCLSALYSPDPSCSLPGGTPLSVCSSPSGPGAFINKAALPRSCLSSSDLNELLKLYGPVCQSKAAWEKEVMVFQYSPVYYCSLKFVRHSRQYFRPNFFFLHKHRNIL